MSDAALEVQVEPTGGALVVTSRGTVDLDTAPVPEAALRRATHAPRAPVVVDMSDVDLLACRGFGVLATARATLSDAGFPLVVTGARGAVRKALRLCDDIARRSPRSVNPTGV
jgi:anti-sigma B factor antagonist